MARLRYLAIHCTDTPKDMVVTKATLEQWHKGPCDLDAGKVKYLGRIYPSRAALPKVMQGGVAIANLRGRGWDRLGYYAIIHRDGKMEVLTPNNLDSEITSDEMTWGVSGINSQSVHVVLEGGKGPLSDFRYHFTEEQDIDLFAMCKLVILHHPAIIIIGHNQKAEKTCPGFFVYDWLMDHQIERWGSRKKRL